MWMGVGGWEVECWTRYDVHRRPLLKALPCKSEIGPGRLMQYRSPRCPAQIDGEPPEAYIQHKNNETDAYAQVVDIKKYYH